jgi:hypothetical protein
MMVITVIKTVKLTVTTTVLGLFLRDVSGVRSKNGVSKIIKKTAKGIPIAPIKVVLPGKYLISSKIQKKYHSGTGRYMALKSICLPRGGGNKREIIKTISRVMIVAKRISKR